MRIGSVPADGGGSRLILANDDGVLDLAEAREVLGGAAADPIPLDVRRLAALGQGAWERLSSLFAQVRAEAPHLIRPQETVTRMGLPVVPEKIIGIGHNYKDLLKAIPMAPPGKPKLFAKWPTALLPPGGDVLLPHAVREVSYEAELVIVIGPGGRDIPPDEALSHVFGYTLADDVTAADAIREDGGELVRAKNYDTFLPLGPWITAAGDVPDVQDLAVTLDQNGIRRQESSTKEMVFTVRELVAFASSVVTLAPGDVILTGSPAGVARFHTPPAYLAPGDRIELTIGPLGTLSHGVTSRHPSQA